MSLNLTIIGDNKLTYMISDQSLIKIINDPLISYSQATLMNIVIS